MQLYCMQYIVICQHLFLFFQKISIWCRLSGNILEIFSKSTSSGTFFHQISNNSAFRGTNMEICPKIGPSCCFFHQISKNGAFHGTKMEIVAKALPHIEKSPFVTLNHNGAPIFVLFFFEGTTFYSSAFLRRLSLMARAPHGAVAAVASAGGLAFLLIPPHAPDDPCDHR